MPTIVAGSALFSAPMRRYARLLLASGLLLATGVLAAPALGAATVDLVHFVTPDREIECDMSVLGSIPAAAPGGFGRVSCGIHRNRFRYSGDCYFSAHEEWSRRWFLTGYARDAAAGAGPRKEVFFGYPREGAAQRADGESAPSAAPPAPLRSRASVQNRSMASPSATRRNGHSEYPITPRCSGSAAIRCQ